MAAAVSGMGVVCLVTRTPVQGLEPVPASSAAYPAWGIATGIVLISLGGALLVPAARRAAAWGLFAVFATWLTVLHLPRLIAEPAFGAPWVTACETVALAVAAWLTARACAGPRPRRWRRADDGMVACFGIAFLIFGASHFVFRAYVESVIPSWLPAPRFWAYATGAAHAAAGVSILTRVLDRLATRLLALMFGSWVIMLHVPRAAADPGSRPEWTSLFVALACGGASAVVAAALADRRAAKVG